MMAIPNHFDAVGKFIEHDKPDNHRHDDFEILERRQQRRRCQPRRLNDQQMPARRNRANGE